MMATGELMDEFPLAALLPKKDIGVERFLQMYPESDGRGTIIAIFDSGVDPGAAGLQKTSDGKRKIVDLIDCSGNGDVVMSVQQTLEDGCLTGITGRKLKIPEEWTNPSGSYRLGVKSAFSLYPESLKDRVQKQRKRRLWDPLHTSYQAKMSKQLASFEGSHQNLSETETIRYEHEDLKATVETLSSLQKKYKDVGPTYDCILFHDGSNWKACIDTSETGDLSSCKLMGTFKESGEFARLTDDDVLNYSFNVYDEGAILSIVTNCSPHGTHVASIASGYFKDCPDLNGVAPGAQIISMQIGNVKVGTMETGSSIMRAVKAAIDNKVDLVNMSYGESVKWPNSGQIINSIKSMSLKHGIIVVSSAGNNGPALSTVGSPGGTSDGVIGIGAHVTPEMMAAEYSLIEKLPAQQYTWSSRGPCVDGSLGVSVVAPGGAIASVPEWTLKANQLMNGTSMSSPNACGGLAVLLSALKQGSLPYSPWSVKMVIENTALKVASGTEFDQGHGMLQVDKAFELFKAEKRSWVHDMQLQVDCGRMQRGIYLRKPFAFKKDVQCNVTISPIYPEDADSSKKLDLDIKLALCSSASWISAPKLLAMANSPRTISIKISTDGLQEGCYYEEVRGYDIACPNSGPVLRVPISIVKPRLLGSENSVNLGSITMKCGQVERWFFVVPHGATWACITLAADETDADCRYVTHVIQLMKEKSFCEKEFRSYSSIKAGVESKKLFPVAAGETMELCIARWWATVGTTTLTVKLTFHGIMPNCDEVVVNGSEGFRCVSLSSCCHPVEVLPVASLTHHVIPITPKESIVRPLGERDVLANGKQLHEVVLSYQFSVSRSTEVIPFAPLLCDLLYESAFDSQFWMLFDSNKQLIRSGDTFTIQYNYSAKLEKGDYTVKFQLRHTNLTKLEAFKDMVLCIAHKLPSSIPLDVHSQRKSIGNGTSKGKFNTKLLQCGDDCLVYFGMPADDKLPKSIKAGHYLTGSVTYANDEAVKRAVKYPLKWFAPPCKSQESKTANLKKGMPAKEPLLEFADALRDFMAGWIGKLEGSEKQKEILLERSDDVHILVSHLNCLDSSKGRLDHLQKIVDVASNIISLIDVDALAKFYGVKQDASQAALQEKSEKDKLKSVLVNAYQKKGLALADLIAQESSSTATEIADTTEGSTTPPPTHRTELNEMFLCLLKWVDPSDSKALLLAAHHGLASQHYGRSIKALLKCMEDIGATQQRLHDDILIKICKQMDLPHVVNYFSNWTLVKYPSQYEPF